MRHPERGMSMWPFVVALVLLLVFIFLWYSQKDETDKARGELADLKVKIDNDPVQNPKAPAGFVQQISELEQVLEKLSGHVGFRTKSFRSMMISDADELAKALNPEAAGSPVAELKAASTVPIRREYFKPKQGAPAPQPLDLAKLPQGFKDKVREVNEAVPGLMPAMPDDPDDAAAMADYAAKRQEWEGKFARWKGLLDELVKMKDFPLYNAIIGGGAGFDLDKNEVVNAMFWERPPTAQMTVEDFVKVPPVIVKYIVGTMKERVEALAQEIVAQSSQKDEARKNAEDFKTQLEQVQAQLAADTARLTREAQEARNSLEQIRVSETAAVQRATQLEEQKKTEVAKLQSEIAARDNRIQQDKEVRDLAIQRDDPDGIILQADNSLRVGYINLGTADKVYPGLTFAVSYIGRGAIRMPKGSVVVTKVLDAHYSQVRIADVIDGEKPMGAKDLISNPFFDANKTIHVFLAGELRKYPRAIAVARLAKMGCIVQDAATPETDWIVVPDTLAVSATPAAAGAEGAAAPAAEESAYDRLVRLAKTFSATLVSEQILEKFLGY
jgi:hypothetical protein